jgi:hypothetical protein
MDEQHERDREADSADEGVRDAMDNASKAHHAASEAHLEKADEDMDANEDI